ncbi:DUF1304 domain-containing protein [Aquicella siphonis]|nr:DUF1304 domain-containing protein [Aquicella siphonis]
MLIINALIILIAFEHIWFMVLEMFLWEKPVGLKTFRISREFAASSAHLAANQGLYNGMLAAGLIWSVVSSDAAESWHLKLFFLLCVTVAGVYGAVSVNRRILFIQALPALIALCLLFYSAL